MSVIPVVRQVRRQVFLTDGTLQFEVSNSIVDRGDLPFRELFVVTITDPMSPKNDILARIATPADIRQASPEAPIYVRVVETDLTRISGDPFARIANINDITVLPRDRVSAVRRGFTTYLSSGIVLIYNNVTTADAAARQIRDRLSTLVDEWRSFNNDFATNPFQDYTLPQPASSVESERTAIYVDRRNARLEAEAARDAAQLEKDACVRDCAADQVIYDFLVYDVAFIESAQTRITAQANQTYTTGFIINPAPGGSPTVTLATNNTRDFALGADTGSYATLLTSKRANLAIYAQKVRTCTETCAQLSAALLVAEQAVVAATAAERVALAGVVSVCPTFDPSTV